MMKRKGVEQSHGTEYSFDYFKLMSLMEKKVLGADMYRQEVEISKSWDMSLNKALKNFQLIVEVQVQIPVCYFNCQSKLSLT